MTLRMAWRSLTAQPVRSAVLAGGFGLGIACMAGLLGVGQVILDQSRSPYLRGGGELVIYGAGGPLRSARFLTSQAIVSPDLPGSVLAVSPSLDDTLYLIQPGKTPLAIQARGGIPSLERLLDDPETAGVESWTDSVADRNWVEPEIGSVLRAMDLPSNIAEGCGKSSDRDFKRYLEISLGSSYELETHLILASEIQGLHSDSNFIKVQEEQMMLVSLINKT